MVIDANLAVWSVLPGAGDPAAVARVDLWQRSAARLAAPTLWLAEVTSAVRREWHARRVDEDTARQALEHLFLFGVELVPMTPDHARSALRWAARVHQSRAYDGFYLALAEELSTDLWTADQRLANAAQAAGAGWVHWIGEPQ